MRILGQRYWDKGAGRGELGLEYWDGDTGMVALCGGYRYEVSTRMKQNQDGGRYWDAKTPGCRNTGMWSGMGALRWEFWGEAPG